jgi:hypothetical protein
VNCNGRFVLEADQSLKTGWGEIGGERILIPKWHHQYSRFRGFVFFNSNDPARIPWNTTKTGIDSEAAVFKKVREKMVLITRGVIDFLNQLDAENDRDEKPLTDALEASPSVLLPEIMTAVAEKSEFRVNPSAGAVNIERLVRISYQKPLGQVVKARQKLGVEGNKDVGSETFDYYFKYECAKKG